MTEPLSTKTVVMRRLHPLSLVFEVASTIRSNILPTVIAVFGTTRGGWIGPSIGAVVLVGWLAIALIRYFTFRYTITKSEMIIEQGLINRLHRIVPLDRIQNIDLSQNLFHRLLRVGEVRVETASGKEPEAIMRVLAISEFERLKSELQAARNAATEATPIPVSIVSNAVDWEQTEQSDQLSSAAIGTHPSRIAIETKPKEQRLVLALPTKLVALGGLLSNRGEVIAGLAIGFLWELKFGGGWLRGKTIRGGDIGDGGESARALASENDAVNGIIAMFRSVYSWWGSYLIIAIGILLLFAVLRAFSAVWYVLRFYGYRLETDGESLHVSCGLFTRVSATIPLGRVQLISIHRTWLQRRFGLASIRIETAGGGDGKSEDVASSVGRKWFVPIIHLDGIHEVLSAIDPRACIQENNMHWHEPSKRTLARMMRPILLATLALVASGIWLSLTWGWIPAVLFGILGTLCVIKKSKSKRYARTAWGIVFKSGTFTQKCSMTFFEKIQGVSFSQSPFDRRWGMANLSIDTASAGPADHRIQVKYLTNEFAEYEFDVLRSLVR